MTLVPAQIVVALDATETLGVEAVFTVMVKAFEVATVELAHATLLVIITVTMSLLDIEFVVKIAVFVPAFTLFTFHWYDGVVPPFVGLAVKVTLAPAQIAVLGALIATLGVTLVFTVIATAFEATVSGLLHKLEDVKTQVTKSLFAKVVLLNVVAFAPETLVPLMRH